MNNKKKYRSFINTAISIYGVLTIDELYALSKYFKYPHTKKGLYGFCLSEIGQSENVYEYLFSAVEPNYKTGFTKDRTLIVYSNNMDLDFASNLLNFKYPIYYDYMFTKEDFKETADKRVEIGYNDIIFQLIYELYDSLDKTEIDYIVRHTFSSYKKKEDLRILICKEMYLELSMHLNKDYASLISDETVDEYMKRLIDRFEGERLTIDSTIFALIPYDKAKELIYYNFSSVRRQVLRGYTTQEIERLEKLDSLLIGKEHLIKDIGINERLFYTALDYDNDCGLIEDFMAEYDEEEAKQFQELIDIIKANF